MPTVEDAIILATGAHAGQRDKAGAPYILHPLRVMLRGETDAERIVGVLHDVVEDTSITFDQLRALGYLPEVLDALDCVTKRPGEEDDYDGFIHRCAANPLARRIKLADLEDNMDLSRITDITEKDRLRLEKYRRAHAYLSRLD